MVAEGEGGKGGRLCVVVEGEGGKGGRPCVGAEGKGGKGGRLSSCSQVLRLPCSLTGLRQCCSAPWLRTCPYAHQT